MGVMRGVMAVVAVCLGLAGLAAGLPGQVKYPGSSEGLVFALISGNVVKNPVVAFDADGTKRNETTVQVRGFASNRPTARFDQNYAFLPSGGSFLVEDGMAYAVAAIQKSGCFTLEAWILPANLQTANGTVLALGTDKGSVLALSQVKSTIELILQTTAAPRKQPPLCVLNDAAPFHLTLTCEKGLLRAFVNGKSAGKEMAVDGDFSGWAVSGMSIGDAVASGQPWQGAIEGIALFSRALTANEIATDATTYAQRAAKRTVPESVRVKAKLINKSVTPDPRRILPYVQAMVMFEYEVEQVVEGKCDAKVIRVQTWTIMEGQKLPVAERPVGQSYDLVLGRVEDYHWLDVQWLDSTLDDNPDLPVYYDITPDVR